jgi:superfamily II DNA/RNA helicase
MTFSSLGLIQPLLRTLTYANPVTVQQQAIPAILARRDLRVCAQTGSGKTAAFALPLLQILALEREGLASNGARALILVPTRELADQLETQMRAWAAQLPLRILAVYGGVSINPQMMQLRPGVDVLIATPGRLLDLQQKHAVDLSAVRILVLDEADRLLDAGFAVEMAQLLALLPGERQNLLLSATFPGSVHALAQQLLREPLRIDLAQQAVSTPHIRQRAIEVDGGRRNALLRYLIKQHGWSRVLVFVASRHAADRLAAKLSRNGTHAAALHGDLSQSERGAVLAQFKALSLPVLVATDLAARGIDIEQMPAVVNYDLPRSPVDYTHRIGRTGRAGAGGEAVSFISAATQAHFRLIEKRLGLDLPWERIPGFEPQEPAPPATGGNGGVKGKRPSKKDKLRAAALAQKP